MKLYMRANKNAASRCVMIFLALVPMTLALAQLTSVPMKDVGNEWVKQLSLKGRMDWEWVETYPEQVYFATRHDSQRQGDIVTMWTRVEYRHSQNPLQHRSSVSRDDWDCRNRRRSTTSIIFYKFNNLEDQTPERSTNSLPSWETIEVGTIGETLLDFACSIQSTTQVPLSLTAPRLNDAAHLIATESEFLFDADHRDIDGISVTEEIVRILRLHLDHGSS